MSFCSYEEAWGSPYEQVTTQGKQQDNYDHVSKTMDSQNVKKMVLEPSKSTTVHEEEGFEDPSGIAPLRGALLGGAIPHQQWQTNLPEVEDPEDSFEARLDAKFDRLISNIDKFARSIRKPNIPDQTSWADVLIFIALGVVAICILDMFFKFGKWIVESKSMMQMYPHQMPMRNQMPQMNYNPQMMQPNYGYSQQTPYFPESSSIPRPSM